VIIPILWPDLMQLVNMAENNLVQRAEIIYQHRNELVTVRALLDKALAEPEKRTEFLNEVKLYAETLAAIQSMERAANGFNR